MPFIKEIDIYARGLYFLLSTYLDLSIRKNSSEKNSFYGLIYSNTFNDFVEKLIFQFLFADTTIVSTDDYISYLQLSLILFTVLHCKVYCAFTVLFVGRYTRTRTRTSTRMYIRTSTVTLNLIFKRLRDAESFNHRLAAIILPKRTVPRCSICFHAPLISRIFGFTHFVLSRCLF